MSSYPVNVAIVGLGRWSKVLTRAAAKSDKIKIVVKSGWLTLEGHVEWNFQKEWAERAVRSIAGVKGVTNTITVQPRVNPGDVKKKIEDALVRSAQVDAQRVEVIADGGKVTLKGIGATAGAKAAIEAAGGALA